MNGTLAQPSGPPDDEHFSNHALPDFTPSLSPEASHAKRSTNQAMTKNTPGHVVGISDDAHSIANITPDLPAGATYNVYLRGPALTRTTPGQQQQQQQSGTPIIRMTDGSTMSSPTSLVMPSLKATCLQEVRPRFLQL